jgi:serine/threonine protein kinase
MFGAWAEIEVERSVRDRLYGERSDVAATARPPRTARPARPDPRGAQAPRRLAGGRYRLVERVGIGGMGSVYRARDERLKREVAIKVIAEHLAREPGYVRRFRREAELWARLAHPNIVTILDAGFEPRDYMVMEFVHGVDAGTLVRTRGWLTLAETVDVVAQVCEALAHAHDQHVVHVDVSPRNILIRRRDRTAKLTDFGLASGAIDAAAKRADVMGTPGYVAPEVLSGARPSPRSDLYSLAVVAYRFLAGPSGAHPSDPHATLPQATAAPQLPPLAEVRPDLSRRLVEAVQQALAPDPRQRQDSVAEFRAQLVNGDGSGIRLRAAV